MAHHNINQRRAYIQTLLDANQTIDRKAIAAIFKCSVTAIQMDIAVLTDPIRWNGLREIVATVGQRRRAKEAGAIGSFTVSEWRALCETNGYCCKACKEQKPLGPDHIIPLSKGGSNDISNIQPLCFECNNKKRAKTVWY